MRDSEKRILACALLLSVLGCVESHSPGDHGGEDHEDHTIAVTNWTGRTELFMEYPALVAGETAGFAIHLTDLTDFSPLISGEAAVILQAEDGSESIFRGGPSRPGIFRADVTPLAAGRFQLMVQVDAPPLEDIHQLGSVEVHGPGSEMAPAPHDEGGEISFLKEQQWTLEFASEPVTVRRLRGSLVVPAVIEPRPGGEAELSAPVPGRIDPALAVPVPGARVRTGEVLARIVPHSEALHDPAGLRAALVDAEQEHGLARQERDRAARLVEEGVLASIELSEAEAAVISSQAVLEAARERLQRLGTLSESEGSSPGGDWFAIRAPFDGVVAEVAFAPAATVEEGDEIVHLMDTDTVHVVGSVPESRIIALRSIGDAELVREGLPAIPLGTATTTGSVMDERTRTVQVRYVLDNRELRIPIHLVARLRLFMGEGESLPAVPQSAIIEESGRPVVFVQTGGESFQRRPVRLGNRENGYVQVLEGIQAGERVVSRGAYLIRLASLSTQVPEHSHVH